MAKPLERAGFWLSGVVCVVLAFLKLAGGGSVVVVASLSAVVGSPGPQHPIHNCWVCLAFFSLMMVQQKKQSRSVQGMVGTVTKSRLW